MHIPVWVIPVWCWDRAFNPHVGHDFQPWCVQLSSFWKCLPPCLETVGDAMTRVWRGRGFPSTSRRSQHKSDKHPPPSSRQPLWATVMAVRWGESGAGCQSQIPFSSFQKVNTNLGDGFAAVNVFDHTLPWGDPNPPRGQCLKSQMVWWVRKSMRN